MNKESVLSSRKGSRISLTTQVYFLTFVGFFLSSLMNCLGGMIDSVIAGHTMDTASLSASSVMAPVFFIANVFACLLAQGTQKLCSELLVSGKKSEARDVYSASLVVGVGLSALLAVVLIVFNGFFVRLLGVVPAHDAYRPCKDYLIGIAFSLPASAVIRQVSTMLHYEGARRWVVLSVVVTTAADVILDLLAVYVFHGGMFAMGLATSISYVFTAAFLLLFYRKKDAMLKPRIAMTSPGALFKAAYNGLPMAVSRLTSSARSAIINSFLASSLTAVGLAAFNVQVQLNYLANAVIFGLAQTMGMMCSIYYAEQNKQNLRKTVIRGFVTHVILGVVVFFLFRDPHVADFLMRFYLGGNEEAFETTFLMMELFGWVIIGQGLAVLVANYLQAIKRIWAANFVYVLDDVALVWLCIYYCRYKVTMSTDLDEALIGSVFLGAAIAQILMILLIPVILVIANRRFGFGWDWLLVLPKGYGIAEDDELTAVPETPEDAAAFSGEIGDFCHRHQVPARTSNIISLAAEELIVSILDHGFRKGKHNRIEARLVYKDDSVILSIRDNCSQYSPIKAQEANDENGSDDENLGIRMVMKLAENVNYTSELKLNNIVLRIPVKE